MKKHIILLTILLNLNVLAQCPVPTNLIISNLNPPNAQFSWTESGSANTWDVIYEPDFVVGSALPTSNTVLTSSNPYVFNYLLPIGGSGCMVFFVRSICSSSQISNWSVIGTSGCSANVYDYLATLADEQFSLNSNKNRLQIAPNPAKNNTSITFSNAITAPLIEVYDVLGKVISSHQDINTIDSLVLDTSKMAAGVYIVALKLEGNVVVQKKLVVE